MTAAHSSGSGEQMFGADKQVSGTRAKRLTKRSTVHRAYTIRQRGLNTPGWHAPIPSGRGPFLFVMTSAADGSDEQIFGVNEQVLLLLIAAGAFILLVSQR